MSYREDPQGLANAFKEGNAADTSSQRRPAVQTELEYLGKLDQEFGELLGILESKLARVLRSPEAAETGDNGRKNSPDVPLTPLVGDLQNASGRRVRYIAHVRDLIDRLEI